MSETKGQGYNSSFLNFVGQNPLEAERNKEDQNSGESSAEPNHESTKDELPPPKPVKRGRLLGPKSVRKQRAGYESNEKSSSESNEEGDEPPAVARRVRSVRAAKVKALQGLSKRRKTSKYKDIESSSSDEAGEVETNDNNLSSDASRGSKYDSDEDPAWKSKKGKSSSSKRQGSHLKQVCQKPSPASKTSSSSSSSRRSTDSGQVPFATSPPISKKPGIEIVSANQNASSSCTPELAPAAAAAATQSSAMATQSKEPSRPALVASVSTLGSCVLDLDPPHHCQKGDFILDRRDSHNLDSYPIWRIDSQRLLQKFEPFEKDGTLLHRALCTYSSWPVVTQQNFTAILVRYISCTRGKEIVEVHARYRPRPVGIRGPELEAMREAFTVYTQILLSQALEPTFMAALIHEPDDYYTVPLEKVKSTINDRRKTIEALCSWNGVFLDTLKKFHAFSLSDYSDGRSTSEATTQKGETAKKKVRFYGHVYDHSTLESFELVTESNGLEFALTAAESVVMTVLHGLYHLTFKLCLVCQTRVDELKQTSSNLDDHDILDTCLRDQPWMQNMFSRLSNLLDDADRVSCP